MTARGAGDGNDMAAALSTQLAFDYGDLPVADAKALERHAESVLKIQDRQRRTSVENALKLGDELTAAQSRLSNHGNGTFGKWVTQRCGMGRTTAFRLITLCENVSDKDRSIVEQTFDLTALYHLLSDASPEEAYRDALKLAKKGEPVTAKAAKELIGKYTVNGDSEPADEEPADESQDDADPCVFLPADFVMSTRKHVREWVNRCPPEDLHFIVEALKDLAAQLERKADGDQA